MRSRTALLAVPALALVFTACDTATPAPAPNANVVTLDARSAGSGDVLYALAPLDLDESFEVELDRGADALRLRSTRTAGGYGLSLDVREAQSDSIVVSYLAYGQPVAEPVTLGGDEPIFAGESANGPDSYHYVYENGAWIIAKDYKSGNGFAGESGGATTTEFRTLTGEVVQVTDVTFTVYGLDAAPPSSVQFESPRDLKVTSQSFGQTLR